MYYGEFSKYAMPITRNDVLERKQHYVSVRDQVKQLTPAGRKLLGLLLNTYNMNAGCSLNRQQIARLLGRPSWNLTPHDRKLLDKLCDRKLLVCERETLWTLDKRPRGSEFRYTMEEDVAWILHRMRRSSRQRRKAS